MLSRHQFLNRYSNVRLGLQYYEGGGFGLVGHHRHMVFNAVFTPADLMTARVESPCTLLSLAKQAGSLFIDMKEASSGATIFSDDVTYDPGDEEEIERLFRSAPPTLVAVA